MKYTILVNQKVVIDNGWKLKLEHLAILDAVVGMINSGKFISVNTNTGLWHWLKINLILQQLPILDIKDRRCKDLLNELELSGLIESNPDNKTMGRHLIRLGKNYNAYLFSDTEPVILQHNIAENCIPTSQNIADTHSNKLQTPTQNIADNNTINNNTIKDKTIDYNIELNFLLQVFNSVMNTNIKTFDKIYKNYVICRKTYSVDEIEKAIRNIPFNKFWHDKMTFVILFRTQNTAKQPVDYISDMLNTPFDKTDKAFNDTLEIIYNGQ